MISRIYVVPKVHDSRADVLRKSFNKLGIKGTVLTVAVIDSYLIDGKVDLEKAGSLLTNKNLEDYFVNKFPDTLKFSYAIEIGFAPGVTDNVAHTVKEEIGTDAGVYTSKIFLLNGKLSTDDVKKISLSLYNPLIERAYITRENNFPLVVPKVALMKKKSVITVPLDISDEELIKIGKEGIQDPDGSRRGPLALDLESMKVIQAYFKKLKRNPTDIELESLAQTWSEHCKHTIFANSIDDIKDGLYKTYIKGATNKIRKEKGSSDFCISVFSDNAGGIVFDKDYMVTHKVETHNSPSALDPFGGAITGIVGVNRDTIGFGMGAKPVANVFGYCFGDPYDTRPLFRDKNLTQKMLSTKRIMDGVIKGVNAGGNCSGIPTVNGFVKYDDRYRGKPLVFAGTVGLIPRKVNGKPSEEKEAKPGDYIVVVGGRVGADGIHGATFSSVVLDSSSPSTAVQIGDPITQKKLSDAIVKEARDMNLYSSITDNGAGGISCSVAEMAKECGGAIVDIEKVPLKYPGLTPWQIWISESQERMTLSVPKKNWKVFKELMDKRGVEVTAIGEFTNSGKCVVRENGKVIMDMAMEFLHNGLPIRHLTAKYNDLTPNPSPDYRRGEKMQDYSKKLLDLISDKNVSGFSFISEQYDHEVQAGSVVKPLAGRGRVNTDAQVIRPVLTSTKGVVLSSSLYPSYGDVNTYDMTACAIDTAIRNSICVGGTLSHLAILDNFCWCSSYDKHRLAQLVDSVRACYDYAVGYGTPFISGKDSMFNDFKGYNEKGNPIAISIPPTLLISSIGVMNDINKSVTPDFKMSGDTIYVLGETHDEVVPKVDFEKNKKTYLALEKVIQKELIASAISVNSGGFGIALAKASVAGGLGFDISIKNLKGNFTSTNSALFSESQGRIVVTVAKKNIPAFEKLVKNIPYTKLGTVSAGQKCIVKDKANKKVVDTVVEKLSKAYHSFSDKMR